MMDISAYASFFHDELLISMESAEIPQDELHEPIILTKQNSLMKKLFLTLFLVLNTSIVLADPNGAKPCIENHDREMNLKKVTAHWTPIQKNAFTTLKQAAYNYFDQRARLECDHSGMDPMSDEYQEQTTLRNNFIKNIKHFEQGHYPVFSSVDFKKSDAALNQAYNDFMNEASAALDSGDGYYFDCISCDNQNACGIPGVKTTEKAWLNYRDAWVTFAAVRYPNVSADSWKTWLTQERIAQLYSLHSHISAGEGV